MKTVLSAVDDIASQQAGGWLAWPQLARHHGDGAPVVSIPIRPPSRVYGWLSLRNKRGGVAFTRSDERLVAALGTHAGISYENARLPDVLQSQLGGHLAIRTRRSTGTLITLTVSLPPMPVVPA